MFSAIKPSGKRISLTSITLLALPLLTAVCVVLSGCGGDGGGGPITPTGSIIRQLQPGDWIKYNVRGIVSYYTQTGEPVQKNISGTITSTVFDDFPAQPGYGGRRIKIVQNWALNAGGTPLLRNVTEYLEQTPTTGTIYTHGIEDSWTGESLLVSSDKDPISYKSPMAIGLTWDYSATYSDDSTKQVNANIVGTEAVSGQMSYKIYFTGSRTINGQPLNFEAYDWFVPDWGFSVQWFEYSSQITEDDKGNTLIITLRITATAVDRSF